MTSFKSIVGIDQTGAVRSNGRPKPLFAAWLGLDDGQLSTNLRLESLSLRSITELVGPSRLPTLILVDSVLGLPRACGVHVRQVIARAADYSWEGRAYGADVAHAFFAQFLSPAERREGRHPTRVAENVAGANSVFRRRPYQRNIGCGSFRVLKDLGQGSAALSIWPFESVTSGTSLIAEAYPTLMWELLCGERRRDPAVIAAHLDRHHPSAAKPRTADDADACVLALGGRELLAAGYFAQPPSPVMASEGWIAGLPNDAGSKPTHG